MWNDNGVACIHRQGVKHLILWAMLIIPVSGVVSVIILVHDELRARGSNHRVPR